MTTDQWTGSVALNLLVGAIAVVGFWLLLTRLRRSVSTTRRARWEREETAYREQIEDDDREGHGDAGGG